MQKGQAVLMKKLGIQTDQGDNVWESLDAYARLFDHPLSSSHLTALATLFGWRVPTEEAELLQNTAGLSL